MSNTLEARLEELNEELQAANDSLRVLVAMGPEADVSFQIEMITDNINVITKEIASIVDAMQ